MRNTKEAIQVWRRAASGVAAITVVLAAGACSHLMMFQGNVERPPASEFGFGPRASGTGLYEATITPAGPLRAGPMHSLTLHVQTAGAAPVDSASITVDGGMPQHGHGLPTRPRITRNLGGGSYQVDGVRFNMGGWWILEFRITSALGTDSVTFHIGL